MYISLMWLAYMSAFDMISDVSMTPPASVKLATLLRSEWFDHLSGLCVSDDKGPVSAGKFRSPNGIRCKMCKSIPNMYIYIYVYYILFGIIYGSE